MQSYLSQTFPLLHWSTLFRYFTDQLRAHPLQHVTKLYFSITALHDSDHLHHVSLLYDSFPSQRTAVCHTSSPFLSIALLNYTLPLNAFLFRRSSKPYITLPNPTRLFHYFTLRFTSFPLRNISIPSHRIRSLNNSIAMPLSTLPCASIQFHYHASLDPALRLFSIAFLPIAGRCHGT